MENRSSRFWLVVANGLTSMRLVIAIYILFFLSAVDDFLWYVIIGGLTDLLDGLAAGRGGKSYFGAIYDKGTDKLFCGAVFIRLAYFCVIFYDWINLIIALLILIAAVIVLEILIAVAGIIFALYFRTRVEASYWGKSKLTVEVIAAALAIFFLQRNSLQENSWLVFLGLGLALLLGCMSLRGYIQDYMRTRNGQIQI